MSQIPRYWSDISATRTQRGNVNALLKNPVFRLLSDLRVGAVLLAIMAVASGVATFVESHYSGLANNEIGRSAAYDMIYDAPWFNVVMIVFCVNLLLNLVRRLARGRQEVGFLMVHIGMLVIMAGAGMTRWMGFEGYLHIREGEANNMVASAKTYAIVEEGDVSGHFPVRLYDTGPQNHERQVNLPNGTVSLSVDEYWIRFEERLMPGPGGQPLVALSTMGMGGNRQSVTLRPGDRQSLGSTSVIFHRGELPTAADTESRYGKVRVRAGGESCSLNVVPEPGSLGSCGGWDFELVEFQTDFHVGGESDPDGPMLNPMVKLAVSSPDGEQAETILFALHPEFGTMHSQADLLSQVDLVYEVSTGVDLAVVDGAIVMRAPFELTVSGMGGDADSETVPVGQTVAVERQKVYAGGSGYQVVPTMVEMSVVETPALSDNPGAPAAARLSVTMGDQRAQAVCVKGGVGQTVRLGDRTFRLKYGPVMRALPYELHLDDFVLETYPGSDNPASYESHVRLFDAEKGVDGEPVRIWMNHPLNHRGTKHFQSSYDRDRLGTVLSVNKDPGKMPTYVGYTIISLGFCIVMVRILARRSQARAAAVLLAAGLALGGVGDAVAQDHGHGQTQAPVQTGPPVKLNLPDDVRESAARLIVQDYRGRMKPLDTLARESSMKITKKSSFEGWHPMDFFLSLPTQAAAWYNYPTVVIQNNGVKKLVGVSKDTEYVSIASLLSGGRYVLQDQVEVAHRTMAVARDKTQQKLITFDERVHILYGDLQGSALRLYPIPDDPGNTWEQLSVVLERLGDDPRAAEFREAGEALFAGLENRDITEIRKGLNLTIALQQKYGAAVMPSEFRINSELFLNSFKPFVKSMMPYSIGFVLLMVAYFWGLFRRDGAPWSLRSPLYALGMLVATAGFGVHLYGYVMRWIASGRAPLSNGHESLLFVALSMALAGLVFELKTRSGASAALGSLITMMTLGVSMMAAFDPAIGPLVPVLASYWLQIHVTVITASYGFLGLSCLLGGLTLILLILARFTRQPLADAVAKLDRLNLDVMVVGIGLLAIGTLLGGVWANESWGRYWGWDPKETWALVSILIYAVVLHFRWISGLGNAFVQAAGSFMSIWSIVMTYFGVNYLLVGLHSYAAGEATRIPTWVVAFFAGMLVLTLIAGFLWSDVRKKLKAEDA